MKLYHGTSYYAFGKIREEGIRPSGELNTDNWDYHVINHPKCVYLTSSYPLQYLLNATACDAVGGIGVIIEIDTELLEQRLLVPDQEALRVAQEAVVWDSLLALRDINANPDDLESYIGTDLWQATLKYSGNCGYMGTIPTEALTRAVVINVAQNRHLIGKLIETICSYHRCMTELMLGYKITNESLVPNWEDLKVVDPVYVSFEKNEQEGEVGSAGEQGERQEGMG